MLGTSCEGYQPKFSNLLGERRNWRGHRHVLQNAQVLSTVAIDNWPWQAMSHLVEQDTSSVRHKHYRKLRTGGFDTTNLTTGMAS